MNVISKNLATRRRLTAIAVAIVAVAAVASGAVTAATVNASPASQALPPAGSLVLSRTFDPDSGELLAFEVIYQDTSGAYIYASGGSSGITFERSATYSETQAYIANLTVTTAPAGEASIISWAENRIAALDDCIVFAQDYQTSSQAQQVAAQDEVGACLELLARDQRQIIKNVVDMLVVNGVIEP